MWHSENHLVSSHAARQLTRSLAACWSGKVANPKHFCALATSEASVPRHGGFVLDPIERVTFFVKRSKP